MEIKEPKFKVEDKVTTPQKGREVFGTIARIKYYDFPKGTYIYTVKFERDGFTEELYLDELVLDAYTEKPKTVWDLQNGDTYYVVDYDDMNALKIVFYNDGIDLNQRKLGNCFLTKEEAESELERVKIEAEMIRLGGRRKFKHNRDNYGMYYSNGINVALWHLTMNQGVIYFDSEEKAKEAVEIIGKDIIKKYIFGVES